MTALDHQVGGDHYKKHVIQPLEFAQRNALSPCEMNIVKYALRWKDKNGLEDVEKLHHYILLQEQTFQFEPAWYRNRRKGRAYFQDQMFMAPYDFIEANGIENDKVKYLISAVVYWRMDDMSDFNLETMKHAAKQLIEEVMDVQETS